MSFLPSLAQFGRHGSAASYDTATLAWAAAVVAAGGTVGATRKGKVDTLIVSLKGNGVWTKLDRLWLFAAENQTAALIDLKALASATAVNSPAFSADRGFTGDGATSYIASGYTPATAGGNLTLNSAHISARSLTALGATSSSQILWGAAASTTDTDRLVPWNSATLASGVVNGVSSSAIANATSQGQFILNRTAASGSGAVQLFLGGSSLGTAGTASTALPAVGISFGAGIDLSRFATLQIASASIGGGLSATDAANLYNAEHAYMQAIGLGAAAP